MKVSINLTPVPNQVVSANVTDLSGDTHIVEFRLRTMPTGYLICDCTIDDVAVVYGRRCVNKMPIALPCTIDGNFYFLDAYDNTDPTYDKLGEQYLLIYDNEYVLR